MTTRHTATGAVPARDLPHEPLARLMTEMLSLWGIMPGAVPSRHDDVAADEARLTAEDAAVEAGFDNMPV